MAEGAGLSGAISGSTKGAKIGKIAGGVIGSVVAPGSGTAAGAKIGKAAGAGLGASLGAFGSLRKQKELEGASQIDFIDQEQLRRQQQLDMMSKNISSGADALTRNNIGQIERGTAQTQNALLRSSGGGVGATTQGLLQAQRNSSSAVNAALANRNNLPQFQNLAQQIASKTAQRRLDLDLMKKNQSSAEYAQMQTDKNLNANAALPLANQEGISSLFSGLSAGMMNKGAQNQPAQGNGASTMSSNNQILSQLREYFPVSPGLNSSNPSSFTQSDNPISNGIAPIQ